MSFFPGQTLTVERGDDGRHFIMNGDKPEQVSIQPCNSEDPDLVKIKFTSNGGHTMARRLFGNEYKVR